MIFIEKFVPFAGAAAAAVLVSGVFGSIGMALTAPLYNPFATDLVAPSERGTAIGLIQSSIATGRFLAPTPLSVLFEDVSPWAPYVLTFAASGISLFFLSLVTSKTCLSQSKLGLV